MIEINVTNFITIGFIAVIALAVIKFISRKANISLPV